MATVKDVARRANVSTATVSRIINNQDTVSPEIRERVLTAIQELDYRPSRVARRLRTNSTFVIGLVISDIQNSFYTSLTRGVEDVASANGYSLLLCNTDEDPHRERKYLEVMHEENVAGIILASATENEHEVKLINAGIPVVALDRVITDVAVDTVLVDNTAGARQAVEHLMARGHRRIGAILGERPITSSIERLAGYEEALRNSGLSVDPDLIRRADLRQVDDSTRCAAELLDLPERPSALFTGNSLITLGALRAINAAGLRIPRDVALVAFDDIPWGEWLDPPLTAIRQPTYRLGQTAAEMLLARIAEPGRPVAQVRLPAELIVRASSGA
jgi:DNA-binding LacI/PurR family transcriptional regulator